MRFEYLQPTTLEEAISLLRTHGEQAKVLAGGTDLIVRMRQRLLKPQYVISIGEIPVLSGISLDAKGNLKIGALTTIRTIETSPEIEKAFPILSQAASQLGSVGVRNLATVGGNICNAAPSADMMPALIVLSATIKIVGTKGERVLPLEDFCTGPGSTALRNGELLVEIDVPAQAPGSAAAYLKHGIRGASDLAIVGVAANIALEGKDGICKDVKIALGAVAPTPIRARQAEAIIAGKRIDEDLIEKAAQAAAAESKPISDVRASDWYRHDMVVVFTKRALRQALALAKSA